MSDGSEFQTVRAATLKPREVKYYHSGSNEDLLVKVRYRF